MGCSLDASFRAMAAIPIAFVRESSKAHKALYSYKSSICSPSLLNEGASAGGTCWFWRSKELTSSYISLTLMAEPSRSSILRNNRSCATFIVRVVRGIIRITRHCLSCVCVQHKAGHDSNVVHDCIFTPLNRLGGEELPSYPRACKIAYHS